MPVDVHKYPLKWYKQNPSEPLKTGVKRAKWASKRGVLGAKSRYFGLKNYGLATKIERPNGAKCRFCS